MNANPLMIASAVALALTLTAGAARADEPKQEKCYGISKAGKNDCQTASASCAGTQKKDAAADAWIYVPAGTCEKIVGASTTPKKT